MKTPKDCGMAMRAARTAAWATVLVFTLAANAAWAGGGKEQEPRDWPLLTFAKAASMDKPSQPVRQSLTMGDTVVELWIASSLGNRYAAYDTTHQEFVPAAAGDDHAVRGALLDGSGDFDLVGSDVLGVHHGKLYASQSGGRFAEAAGQVVQSSIARVSVSRYGEPTTIRALVWDTARNGYTRVSVDTPAEFFAGEGELFAGVPALSYPEKALALLRSTLPEDARAPFRTAAVAALGSTYPAVAGATDSVWSTFDTFQDLDDYRLALYGTLQNHVKVRREKLTYGIATVDAPLLSWSAGSFSAVYGAKPAPYTAGWLRYCLQVGKPVLAALIDAAFPEGAGYRYDWRQYEPLTGSEGQRLAEAALRYLTWGYEYQLPAWPQEGRPTFSAALVGSQDDKDLLRDWVLEAPGGDALTDYLPDGQGGVHGQVNLGGAVGRYAPGQDAGVLAAVQATRVFSVAGNPVAWVPGGTDTPRTFNYKLFEARRARELASGVAINRAVQRRLDALSVTLQGDRLTVGEAVRIPGRRDPEEEIRAQLSLVPEVWRYASGADPMKPFAAGAASATADPDRQAGVDASGLLSGTLGMVEVTPQQGEVKSLWERVLSASNSAPADSLRGYAAMAQGAGAKGLDAGTKLPIFYSQSSAGDDSVQGGGYAFSRVDLERASVLVPDLSEVQLGDLVLGTGQGYQYELGIVVGTVGEPAERNTAGFDSRVERAKIVVLSVNAKVGHVFLSRWANGTFTADADAFQLRRLVRLRDGVSRASLGAYPEDEVDPIADGRNELLLDVGYARKAYGNQNTKVEEHLIPNISGQQLGIESIRMQRIGEPILSQNGPVAQLMPFVDYGYGAQDSDEDLANHGGRIKFLAVFQDGGADLLGVFRPQPGTAEYVFDPAPGSNPVLGATGMPTTEAALKVEGGRLVYHRNRRVTMQFALEAEAAEARPGDDILLQFALRETGRDPVSVAARAGDYAAVYDTKMLWRANLYVAEPGLDWNDANPWTNNSVGDPNANDWYASGNGMVPGGQIPIRAFTQPVLDTQPQLGGNVAGAVAYSWGGTDSPADFNQDMLDQLAAIRAYYGQAGPDNPHPEWAKRNTTTAPEDDWLNYLPAWDETAAALAPIVVGSTTHYPYRPGYALKRYVEDLFALPPNSRYIWEDVNYSAGVDCSGLVNRVAAYEGNEYTLYDPIPMPPGQVDVGVPETRETWATSYVHIKRSMGVMFERSTKIWDDEADPEGQYDPQMASAPLPIQNIVPGDIVLFRDPVDGYHHSAIVSEVRYVGNSRTVTREGIVLIEAASGVGYDRYRVLKTQTLWQYRTAQNTRDDTFRILRLAPR